MIRLFQSNWMTALIGSALYLAITITCLPSGEALRKAMPPKKADGLELVAGPSWDFKNPEIEQMVREIRQQKEVLDLRATQIEEMETRLRAEQAEITTVTQLIARLQKDFDQNIIRLKEQEVTSLKRLAKTHAAMTPEGSAKILKELNDDEIVKILTQLKADEAGPILEATAKLGKDDARRAAQISERLRNVIPPPSTQKKNP